uniref:Homing endonuclease n=1 Tax=Staphylococcus phage 184DA TaxID=3110532 RepID=A0AAU6MXH1_9CAUD
MLSKNYLTKIKEHMINNNLKFYTDDDYNSFRLFNYKDYLYLDYIMLGNVPKKLWNGKASFDWKNSINIKIKCVHKNKEHNITIIEPIYNENPVSLKGLKILSGDKEYIRNKDTIKLAKLNFLSGTFDKNYRFNVGDIVANCTVLEQKRLKSKYKKSKSVKGYKVKCNFTGIVFDWDESSLRKRKFSPYYNRLTVTDENCLWNQRPDLRPYIKDKEYAKKGTTPFSRTNTITLQCPNCKSTKFYKVKDLPKVYDCRSCSNNTPFTEKLFEAILKANNIKYETQKRMEGCENLLPLPFDFYLTDYNILVEIQGIQHYQEKSGFSNSESFDIIKKRDKIKLDFCKDNNIKIIYIDAKKSNYDYIMKSIESTELKKLLDLSIENVIKENLMILNEKNKYPIDKIIQLVDSGYSYRKTAQILNEEGYEISRHTVSRKYNNFKKID